jgi:nitroreductase
MTHANHRGRRWFLAAGAGLGAAAASGLAIRLDEEDGRAEYEQCAEAIWRHSDRTDVPFPAAQRELVRYATLAANKINTQPWFFRLLEDAIVVLPDFYGRSAPSDTDGHDLFVSLGCAVENMVQAAGAFGLQASPSFERSSGNIVGAIESAARRAPPLFDAIPRRQSTRGAYSGRQVPAEQLRLLEAAGSASCVSALMVTEQKRLERILEYCFAKDEHVEARQARSWIHYSYREALTTRDGMFVKLDGYSIVPAPIARALMGVNLNVRRTAARMNWGRELHTAACVVILVSQRNDPAHWVEAGRCCQRLTLQATALGIRTAYISKPLDAPDVRGQFATEFGVGGQRPDAIIRFGYAPERLRSLRRPVDQVIRDA